MADSKYFIFEKQVEALKAIADISMRCLAYDCMMDYLFYDKIPETSNPVYMFFVAMRPFRDESKNNEKRFQEKQIENWSKWWRPHKNWRNSQKPKKANLTQKTLEREREKEKEREIEEEIEDKKILRKKIIKKKFLDFVSLSDEEFEKLKEKLWVKLTNKLIEKLNNYIWSKGVTYKSHYFTILNRSNNEQNNAPPWWISESEKQKKLEEYRERRRREAEREEAQTSGKDWKTLVQT